MAANASKLECCAPIAGGAATDVQCLDDVGDGDALSPEPGEELLRDLCFHPT
jgi:hypothetical protein